MTSAQSIPVYRRLPVYLLAAIVLLGGMIRWVDFDPSLPRTPDEHIYTRDANILLLLGTAQGYKLLGDQLAADPPAVSLYPSSLRVGYITPLSLYMRWTGNTTPAAGGAIAFFCSMASLLLIALLAYCALSPTAAVVAALFFAVLPFDLIVYQRTWEEAYINLIILGSIALATVASRRQGYLRLAAIAGMSVAGLLALTTKETCGVTFLLCIGGLGVHFFLRHERAAATMTAAAAILSIGLYVTVLALLFGGVHRSLTLVLEYAHFSGINIYSVLFDSGPVWLFPAGLLLVSPFVMLAGSVGAVASLMPMIRRRSSAQTGLSAGLALLVVAMLAIQVVAHRYSYRYTAPIYGALCLLAGIGAAAILPRLLRLLAPLGRAAAWAVVVLGIGVAAYRDLNFAQERLIGSQMQDLSMRPILNLPPAPVPPNYPRH